MKALVGGKWLLGNKRKKGKREMVNPQPELETISLFPLV